MSIEGLIIKKKPCLQILTKVNRTHIVLVAYGSYTEKVRIYEDISMKNKTINILPVAILAASLTACNSGGGSKNSSNDNLTTNNSGNNGSSAVSSCADAITAGISVGITALPLDAAAQYKNAFCKYTKLTAPNGKPIHFYAQNRISNEQMIRARNILQFYLTNVPGSIYGTDKTSVFNKMGDNNATLVMYNGSDGDVSNIADGQTLYETENVVEGSAAYLTNEPRDAAFEEILHLMHDTGIGVDFSGAMQGVLPSFQAEIRVATNNAAPSSIVTGGKGLWASVDLPWLRELKAEGSLTQEYLASVIDTYYGLAGKSSAENRNDLYTPQTREEIKTKDPMGWALVGDDSPRKFFSEYVTYEARIDPSYTGIFTLNFDPALKYTYKSQYLVNATLLGNNNSQLIGNNQANILRGNDGDNRITGGQGDDIIDGGEGSDSIVFTGIASEYTIINNQGTITVTDNVSNRDGIDQLTNVELLIFSDSSLTP